MKSSSRVGSFTEALIPDWSLTRDCAASGRAGVDGRERARYDPRVMHQPFQKVLVANRGEIAVRIIRTLQEMGIVAVAVFSESDRTALHVRHADEAYCIGAPSAADSYLRVDKVVSAAMASGCDAVHPGYGFLSENPLLPEACEALGLAFIGPPKSAMRAMASKTGEVGRSLKPKPMEIKSSMMKPR